MSKLTEQREKLHLTQEELAEKSGISVRTIQRIESGQRPKGYTRKALARALDVDESYFDADRDLAGTYQNVLKWNKIVNLSVLPFVCFPPLNILVPLAIIVWKKQFNPVNRQLLSIQIVWTLASLLLFVFILILNDWLAVQSNSKMLIPIVWITLNGLVIVRNALVLNSGKTDRIYPNINML
ncbi:helix-turn-helix protein [Sphingobacterium allocomposti]|uniref:Helix-turn-helix protein n=1 Tax=Sphingobacterium allocomposti TaxID=415956 RepID=A0A5S5DMH6_9SPHI|nr:helix-turn-helix transcriptional regulator [Sphingobacterium composti Yoo et al. 2007 non Ten et al. 2007]TYP96854.1 helix-turn-helix protein [Sphingobacterium composti Yoo et al. 2007 non Ten et al. 2007]